MRTIQRFLSDERAATAIEYAVIGALVSMRSSPVHAP